METKDTEDAQPADGKGGGWITFPFLAGTMMGVFLAAGGATSNIIVYLIKEYNVKSVDAAQINNIINGCTSLSPVAGAIISDAFFGCFPVVAISTFVNFLSLVLFTITAAIRSLRPTPCTPDSDPCREPSAAQLAVLYAAVALLSVGMGGTRFNLITMGADQFDDVKDQNTFFNWYFVIMYTAAVISATVIVYVQDSVSWMLGFGLCLIVNAVSVLVLMMGKKYYRRPRAKGSPFTGIARVVVAAVRKRKVAERREGVQYFYGSGEEVKSLHQSPSSSFRFLNRAAIITDGDTSPDGNSVAETWHLCTVQQVEDLKTLLRICPLWTSSIVLSVSIGIQASLTVLQALTMDRSLGPHFTFPAGSVAVFLLATVALVLPLLDRLPTLVNLTPDPFHRIGLGHVLNAAGMAVSALVERRRSSIVTAHNASADPRWTVPMSVLWLVLPMATTGLSEAMHFPAQVALYYQEFPGSMKSTATGVVALLVAVGFYGSTAVVGVVRRVTRWLPDNVNASRMENVFWLLAVAGGVNFGYFVVCAWMYNKYKKPVEGSLARAQRVGK